jgi:hypothetical protein
MSFSSYLKTNRKLIACLLAVIAIEVGCLIFWGAIAYKNEKLDAEAQLKEFIDVMNQKDREEQEKWKDLQTRLIECNRLMKRVQKINEQVEKLREETPEVDLETRFHLAQMRLHLDPDRGFPILERPHLGSWDIYPPGHPYGPNVEIGVIIKSPRALSGKPFLGIEGDHLKSIEESAISDQHSHDD